MEAKDTVMSRKEKQWFIVERSHQQTVGESQEDMLLEKQAEISFKAGIKEAADFLESIGMNDGIMNCFEPDKWRVFLNDKDRGGKK